MPLVSDAPEFDDRDADDLRDDYPADHPMFIPRVVASDDVLSSVALFNAIEDTLYFDACHDGDQVETSATCDALRATHLN